MITMPDEEKNLKEIIADVPGLEIKPFESEGKGRENKMIVCICSGHHSRASNMHMNDCQRHEYDKIEDNLKRFFDEMGYKWETLEITLSEKE